MGISRKRYTSRAFLGDCLIKHFLYLMMMCSPQQQAHPEGSSQVLQVNLATPLPRRNEPEQA